MILEITEVIHFLIGVLGLEIDVGGLEAEFELVERGEGSWFWGRPPLFYQCHVVTCVC
jgi:hypothetical protein